MIARFKSKAFGFWEVLIIVLVVFPCIIFSISSVQEFALIEYYQIKGYPPLDDLERIEGNLIELGYCTYSKGSGSRSKAEIQTENGVVSLITSCDIDKVAKKFFLKNENIVAYKERLPSFILRSSKVVNLTVNDIEIINYQTLIEYQNSHKVMIRTTNLTLLFFWVAAFWWGWRYFKKQFLGK